MTRPVTEKWRLDSIPEGMFYESCTFVDPRTLFSLSRVNKRVQEVVQRQWESLARNLITGHFGCKIAPHMPIREQFERLCIAESTRPTTTLQKMILEGHEESDIYDSVIMSKDGKRVFSSGFREGKRSVKLWDLTTGNCLVDLQEDHRFLQISDDGRKAFSIQYYIDKWVLALWDLKQGEIFYRIALRDKDKYDCLIENLCVSKNSKRALVAETDGTLTLWDLDAEKELSTILVKDSNAAAVKLGYDGKRVLVYLWDGKVQIWNLIKRTCIYTSKEKNRCLKTRISYDGRKVFAQFEHLGQHHGYTFILLDLISGNILTEPVLNCNLRMPVIEISCDETRAITLAVDSDDNSNLQYWDLTTGKCLHTLRNCSLQFPTIRDSVKTIKISQNGRKAVSLSCNGILQLWDLRTGRCLHTARADVILGADLQMDEYGMTAIATSPDGKIVVWNLAPLPEESLCAVAKTFRKLQCELGEKEFKKLPSFVQNSLAEPYQWIQPVVKLAVALFPQALSKRLECYQEETPNTRARNISLYNAKVTLPKIAKIFGCANETLLPIVKQLPHPLSHRIYDFLDPQSGHALLLTHLRAACSLSKASMMTKHATARLMNLPMRIRRSVYVEIIRQRSKEGTLPENKPSNFGELAFHNREGYCTTPAEKSAAVAAVWYKLSSSSS